MKLNAKLNDVHYTERDFHRIDKVVKAIKHNIQKLKDIYYDDFIKQQTTGDLKIHPNQSSIDDFLKDWFMKKFYILFQIELNRRLDRGDFKWLKN